MKFALALMMVGCSALAVAQDNAGIPPELLNMDGNDPRAKQYEPTHVPGLEDYVIPTEAPPPPKPCLDLSATPRTLPNGEDEYPTKVCVPVDYTKSYDEDPQPVAPQGTPVQASAAARQVGPPVEGDPAVPMDLNTLQMQRLGELDAMQGRPLSMQYATSLGYMQGYVSGQKRRMQAPTRPNGGGFRGF
jgi:hypothetical protein